MEKQVSEGSLHKWFKGSKSKDGKGGWVNVVTGGTCASDEPGEGTPKCVSSAKRASMTKAERLSAARRKKKADPGQQQKTGAAKPTYVSTDKKKKKMKESYSRSLSPLSEKAQKCWKGYEKKGTKKMFGKTYNNCVKKEEVILERQKTNQGERQSEEQHQSTYGKATVRNKRKFGFSGGNAINAPKETSRGTLIDKRREEHKAKRGVKTKGMKEAYSANPAQQAAIAIAKKKKKEDDMVAKKKKQKMYAGYEPEGETIEEADKKGKGSGSKDACYHKVKSRYSVWPSAYASGALVKCRKVGAANWGNSSKKEDFSDWKAEFIWEDGDSAKKIEEGKIKPAVKGDGFLGPTVGGLGVPNPIRITKDVVDTINRNTKNTVDTSNKILPNSASMGKFKEFNKTVSPATTKLLGIKNSYKPEGEELDEASPAWQRKEGKSESGGLNKKGVASYRAANPGSKLKTAVTTKPSKLKRGSKSAKRRKSFCSRMKGMKKKLTSAKTARDPDSRINKALRKWNC